jgi:hypothetical protein
MHLSLIVPPFKNWNAGARITTMNSANDLRDPAFRFPLPAFYFHRFCFSPLHFPLSTFPVSAHVAANRRSAARRGCGNREMAYMFLWLG